MEALNATYGQTLSQIALPEGFSWVDANASVGNAGTNTFAAIYNAGENYNLVEVTVTVNVAKIDPAYTIPTGLSATEGDALSTIELPAGFAWKDGNEALSLDKAVYTAVFTPVDTNNYNTIEVEIPVTVTAKPVVITDKFAQKMPAAQFTYRLGNGNTVALNSIFAAIEGAEIDNASVSVTITAQNGHDVKGTYTANTSDWTKGTLKFEGTGLVTLTIKDATSNEFSLTFEIVNAVNATSATSAKTNNVVLLNNVTIKSSGDYTLLVGNGYTMFGNGFTISSTEESYADSMMQSYLRLENGTLDNVRIEVPFFGNSFLYLGQASAQNEVKGPYDKTYYNIRSAVYMLGNSAIKNSYISGGRAGVYVVSGNPVIENTTIYGGSTANIHVGNVQSLTLKDMTLIQKPIAGTVNGKESNTVMGFGVVFEIASDGVAPVLTLEGYLDQFAWVNSDYADYVPDGADNIITEVMKKTQFLHNIEVDGVANEQWMSLGIAYWPLDTGTVVQEPTIYDNRTNKAEIPYEKDSIKTLLATAYVYSISNSNAKNVNTPDVPEIQSNAATLPNITFNGLRNGVTFANAYNEATGWTANVTVDLDTTGEYTFNFADLIISKYGKALSYTVEGLSENTVTLTDSGIITYTLHITDDVDCNGNATMDYTFVLTSTKTSIEPPVKINEPTGEALLVVKSYGGDWSAAVPALQGAKVKYYDKTAKAYLELNLSDIKPSSKGKLNGTNNYWDYTDPQGDFTLRITSGYIHEGKLIYGMPISVNDDVYFTISSTNGYVSTGTSARTVTLTYEFTDSNGQSVTFAKTWNCNRQNMIDAGAEQYSYSEFVNGNLSATTGGGGSSCVTPDTLITLANGTQVRVDSLTGAEELLVWNMETGMLDTAPIMFVDSDPIAEYEIVHLYFSDGTDVKVISEHGFWDYDLNRYVYLDANAAAYIGHTFAKQSGDALAKVQLVDVVIENEVTEAWSPVTAGHLCYFVNDMLSMPGGVGGLFNIFDVNAETMTYDYEAMARDIETYGLFTYEELNSIVELPEEMFEAAGGAFMKISMGKGNLTMEELIAMIVRYTKFF